MKKEHIEAKQLYDEGIIYVIIICVMQLYAISS